MAPIRLCPPGSERLNTLIPPCDALAFLRITHMLDSGKPLLLSDGESCLVAQSDPNSPAWVWTRNGISDETLAALLESLEAMRLARCLSGIVAKGSFIRLAALAWDAALHRTQRIAVYRMDRLIPKSAPGEYLCGADVPPERAGALLGMLAQEDGVSLSASVQLEMGEAFSKNRHAFGWRAPDGTIAAIAKRADAGDRFSDVHSVVTDAPYRGCGYAKALLTKVCAQILEEGRVPMLYADPEYPPSNAAYRAIGFTEKARLTALRLIKKS